MDKRIVDERTALQLEAVFRLTASDQLCRKAAADLTHLLQIGGHIAAHPFCQPGAEDPVAETGEHMHESVPLLGRRADGGIDGLKIKLHRLVADTPHVLLKKIAAGTGINMADNLTILGGEVGSGDDTVLQTADVRVLPDNPAEFFGEDLLNQGKELYLYVQRNERWDI